MNLLLDWFYWWQGRQPAGYKAPACDFRGGANVPNDLAGGPNDTPDFRGKA